MATYINYNIQERDYNTLKEDKKLTLVYPSTVYWSEVIRSLSPEFTYMDKASARWDYLCKKDELFLVIPDPQSTPAKSEFLTAIVQRCGRATDPEGYPIARWIYYLELKYCSVSDFNSKALKKGK